jgi:hypothetical protein
MKKVLKNDFSWSVSRDSMFQECPRKYYFTYYGYWGGWELDAAERVREIYILKRLKNRAIWIGEVVHDCIARSLKNLSRGITVLPLKNILSITRNRMRQDFRSSKNALYRQNPVAYPGLFEHEYDVDVGKTEWKAAAEQVDICLNNFYASPYFKRFTKMDKAAFLEVEKFSSFDLDGFKIQIKLDCACKENGNTIVWDWKTGKSSKSGFPLQMACYAHYAGQAYIVDPTEVITRQFNLSSGLVQENTFARNSFDELFSYMRGSIRDMLELLDDRKANTASEAKFAKVETAPVCLKCNFLKVCKPNI